MKYKKYGEMPEGAISLENIDEIYMERLLEEGGAEDLIPVLSTYAKGQVLEEEGKFKEATALYKESLRHHPENSWMKEALGRIKYMLH